MSRMTKAFIRLAVDLALAENGYPVSLYGWEKPGWLKVWTGHVDEAPVHLHLPAVKTFTREMLFARLGSLHPIGTPLEAPIRHEPVPEATQIDLEELLRDLRARDEPPAASPPTGEKVTNPAAWGEAERLIAQGAGRVADLAKANADTMASLFGKKGPAST